MMEKKLNNLLLSFIIASAGLSLGALWADKIEYWRFYTMGCISLISLYLYIKYRK